MNGMETLFYFGVIGRSGHNMWLNESVEMFPLPSGEYINRQRTKNNKPAPAKRVRNPGGDPEASWWLTSRTDSVSLPWPLVDGVLCPGVRGNRVIDRRGDVAPRFQVEGQYTLHHRDGWTALAWWDRSGCDVFWSNSVLFARGRFSADEMLAMARVKFPLVMERITYEFVPGFFSDVTRNGDAAPMTLPVALFSASERVVHGEHDRSDEGQCTRDAPSYPGSQLHS